MGLTIHRHFQNVTQCSSVTMHVSGCGLSIRLSGLNRRRVQVSLMAQSLPPQLCWSSVNSTSPYMIVLMTMTTITMDSRSELGFLGSLIKGFWVTRLLSFNFNFTIILYDLLRSIRQCSKSQLIYNQAQCHIQ